MGAPLVTVVVLNYNGAHLLPACLDSLRRQDYAPLDLVVVDNGSVDESREVVAAAGLECLALADDTGLARGFNHGAAVARGDHVFFASHDMRFEPDCVRHLVAALEADPAAFAADPLQYDWTGAHIVHFRTVLRAPRTVRTILPWPPRVRTFAPAADVVEVPWGCAGCLLVRRAMFEALGGFDPSFFLDFEDLDVCWRAWRRGWKTYFVPRARLFHRVAATTDAVLAGDRPALAARLPRSDQRRLVSQQRNHQRFVLKTMTPPGIAIFHAVKIAALLGYLATGRFRVVRAMLRAWLDNARDLGDIVRARRALGAADVPHDALVARFGVYTAATADRWPAAGGTPA
jgi:GT2 family glycosyltransferase